MVCVDNSARGCSVDPVVCLGLDERHKVREDDDPVDRLAWCFFELR